MDLENVEKLIAQLKIKTGDIYSTSIGPLLAEIFTEKFNQIKPYKPPLIADVFQNIRKANTQNDFENVRKRLILDCIKNYCTDYTSEKYPDSIQIEYQRNVTRIYETCESDIGWRDGSDDIYWKDLAIIRLHIFPAGSGIVEAYSGFGTRQGLSHNLAQSLSFLKMILLNGKKPYYQTHIHHPLLKEFNELGRIKMYLLIAEMLIQNPNIKGVHGGSWFYDPKLEMISPRLNYLRELPVNNGAYLFCVGEDLSKSAFSKSETRKKLFKEGRYTPMVYMLVWPRDALIKWAENYKRTKLL